MHISTGACKWTTANNNRALAIAGTDFSALRKFRRIGAKTKEVSVVKATGLDDVRLER
ncbi:hypothetical protein [Methylomonas sp. ZR1]|uniref:hypothetical protein n=1 Tax=Methylomonas sp. ZR1 TaxID=1797072 RepID=UPI0014917B4A|nr:hypothetical protein [Methylomonas sp. ZR1]